MTTEHDSAPASAPSCCPPEPAVTAKTKKRNLGAWATVGSLASAVLASACCWLPLLAVAFGASAAGVGAVFDQYRPYFLGVAVLLLGTGFYFLYVRKEACEPGTACTVPNVKARGFSRAMFWVAVLFISAFAFFPNYVGHLLGGTTSGNVAVAEGREVQLDLQGMTCEGCAANITIALQRVDGVQGVDVDYKTGRARVVVANAALAADPAPLLRAVEGAGYKAVLIASPASSHELTRHFTIEGMTCQACAVGIQSELAAVPGVAGVDVSYEQKLATVRLQPEAKTTVEALVAAIKKAGYSASPEAHANPEAIR